MTKKLRLGMLTPSCNIVLEPVTSAMVAALDGVTAHFSRFRVVDIALGEQSLKQFDIEPMLQAAQLLADAKVDVIAWNGTAGGWLGLENDRNLCAAIKERTGIPATTTVLATETLFELHNVKRFGLVSPYTEDVQSRIIKNFREHGYECVAEERTNGVDGFSFAATSDAQITGMLNTVARAKPDASIVFCTNVRGAPLAEKIEHDTGVPVFDSISVTVWDSLRIAGFDTTQVRGWGQLFNGVVRKSPVGRARGNA